MHHMDIFIEIKDVLCAGEVKYRFFKSHNFRNFTSFPCGYGCIKRDKMDSIE